MPPTISAVVPAYDNAAHLPATLDAIAAQTDPVDQLIVIDDGSRDDTADVVRRWIAAHPDVPAELHTQPNAGTGAARNAGAARATGDWLAFCDADDLWLPERCAALRARLAGDDLDLLCGAVQLFDDGEGDRGVRRPPADLPTTLGRRLAALDNPIATSAAVVRRAAFVGVGGFDEHPDLTSVEDYELWLRGAAAGWRVAIVDEPLVRYRLHAGQSSRAPTRQLRRAFRVHRRHVGDGLGPRLARARHVLRSVRFGGRFRPLRAQCGLLALAFEVLLSAPQPLPPHRSRTRR